MNGHDASLGHDRIRYLVRLHGRWRWRPTKVMRAAGFRMIHLSSGVEVDGRNLPSAADISRAVALNTDWDRARRGLPALAVEERLYPEGSIGCGYLRAMRMRAEERTAKNKVWTSEHASRDDWPRAWRWIEPLFADCDPKTVLPEQLFMLRTEVASRVSDSEAHRVIKVWRALWAKMAVMKLCPADQDPSRLFANSAPQPRQDVWAEGEAARLVKQAWRAGYRGLAALLAVAWDSQLSPVDARNLRVQDKRRDPIGTWFAVSRAKTGRAALATLSRRSVRLLDAYLASLPAEPMGAVPLFQNRSGRPYSKDTLGDDFRDVRAMVFGTDEKRQLADFRRSGSTEALAGGSDPAQLSSKMANSLSASNRLHKTYGPVQLASVRQVDEDRKLGRARLREQNPAESVTEPGKSITAAFSKKPKSLK